MKLQFAPNLDIKGGRMELWPPATTAPAPGRKPKPVKIETWRPDGYMVLGLDFAYGLSGSDFDAAVGLDEHGRQVLEMEGRWGVGFAGVLKPVLNWWGKSRVFIVGEATATGIPVLQELYNDGYWLYHRQQEDAKGAPTTDFLGHAPGKIDITITKMRLALSRDTVTVRSQRWFDQLCAYRFLPRRAGVSLDIDDSDPDRAGLRDRDVIMGAPPGEHDDLVRAGALAAAGLDWLPLFEPPAPELPFKSIGKFLGYDREADDTADSDYF